MTYTDAKKIRHGVYLIGYCDEFATIGKAITIKASDNNVAEMAAIKLALKDKPHETIYTDSLDSVTKLNLPNVVYISRDKNFCDRYLDMVNPHK